MRLYVKDKKEGEIGRTASVQLDQLKIANLCQWTKRKSVIQYLNWMIQTFKSLVLMLFFMTF
jgi:Ctr copper transporter family.